MVIKHSNRVAFCHFHIVADFFARNTLKGWNFCGLVMSLCYFFMFDKFLKLCWILWICGKIDRNDVEENANIKLLYDIFVRYFGMISR